MKLLSKQVIYSTIALSSLLALLYALYLQHIGGHQPCVLCVHIRLAFLLTFLSSSLALAKSKLIRNTSHLILWVCILSGGKISYELYQMQNHPNPFATCTFTPEFWLPLDQWFPFIFKVQGNCTDEITTIFNASMASWGVAAFSIFAVLMLLLYKDLFKLLKRR